MAESPDPPEPRDAPTLLGRRICVIYDCLFPATFGGAERWYQVLVDRMVESGADVTYLTRQQWPDEPPVWPGVDIVTVGGTSDLYDAHGTRRTGPALRFGAGTFWWLLHHRRRFDAVVVASFPFFSLLGATFALAGTRTPLFVDYFEVWSPQYWRYYAGRVTGTIGAVVQGLCIRVTRYAQVFVEENARRLRSLHFRGDVATLAGLLPGDRMQAVTTSVPPEEPVVLFVGRHVTHKGVGLLPEILAAAHVTMPELRMVVVSDGPERAAVEGDVARRGLTDFVTFTGAVAEHALPQLFARASCTVVPSLREGYGIVVVESVSAGTPVVVANNPENLATGLVEPGVNGVVVDPSATSMARGIVDVIRAGSPLRRSTAEWSAQHSAQKTMDHSAAEMIERLSTNVRARPARRT